ncbi:MAG: hypothetical protein EHM57_02620, partial [Actinobacteria bacterium]
MATDVVAGDRDRHPALAAFLSALVPGAGQWYARRPRRGLYFFAPTLLLIVAAFFGYRRGAFGLVELAVQPDVLRGLIAADIAVLAWRLWAVIDAYLIAAGREYRTDLSKVLLVLLIALLAVPHLLAGAYAARGIPLIESVFGAEVTAAADGAGTLTDLDDGEVPDPALFHEWYSPIDYSARNMIFRRGLGDPDAIAALADILSPPSLA